MKHISSVSGIGIARKKEMTGLGAIWTVIEPDEKGGIPDISLPFQFLT